MTHESLKEINSLMDTIDSANGNTQAESVQQKKQQVIDSETDTAVGKIGTLVMAARDFEGIAEKVQLQIKDLENQKKAAKSKRQFARNIIREIMDSVGITKVTAGTNNVSIIPSGKKPVQMSDDFKHNPKNNLPPKYWKETTSIKINEDLLRKDIEDGVEIPGVSLGEKGDTLRIG